MKNRLWTGEERAQLERDLGPLMAENEVRRTGRSTACALRVMAEAMQNPGVPVEIIDHAYRPGFSRINQIVVDYIKMISAAMRLQYLTVYSEGAKHYLRYDIFE